MSAADIAVAIGISSEPAKVGRNEILSFGNDIVAMYSRIKQAQAEQASQTAGAGIGPMSQSLTATNAAAEKLTATFDKLAERVQRVPRAGQSAISEAERAAAAVMQGDLQRAQASQKAESAIASLDARLGLISQSARTYAVAQKELDTLYKSGAITSDQYAQRMAMVKSASEVGTLALDHHGRAVIIANDAHAKMRNSLGLSTHEMRNLSYQINDVVSGLAMGQSPMMILTQQGGQFVQIFQQAGISMGGVALGIGAVAVAAIALVAPLARLAEMNQEARTLDLTLRAVGNTANVSGGYLQKLAEQTAKISMSSRADITSAFSAITSDRMGRGLSPDQIQKLTLAAEGYAAVTGKSLPDATTALMKAVTGGFDSMVKLSAQFPLATKAELENLRVMSQHGDIAGVLALEIELLNRKFSGLASQGASESQKAIHGLTTAWDEFLTSASQSKVVVGALEAITAAMRGLSDEIKNAPAQLLALLNPSTQLVELAKLYANGSGWSQMGNSPMLSMPMPPPLAANQNGAQGSIGGTSGSIDDAFSAKTNAILAAAHAQAAAYDLVGIARQKALVSAQFDQQIIAAGADMEKVAEARAQKRATLLMIDAQARGQTVEMIDSLKRQTAAQQELNTAIGRGYEARKRAEIENAVAAEKFKNPAMSSDEEVELRRDLARKEEARRAGEEFTDLQSLQDSAKYENMLADARLRGADALRLANVEIETQKRLEKYGGSESDIRKAVNDNSLAQQRSELASKASGLSATLQSKQELQALDLVIAKMRELGATADEIAQVYQNAEIRKLEATQDWADGARASLMRYSQNASNYGAMAGNVVSSGMRSMENALVSFSSKTMTAAQAFKSMAASIIQDLIRMQVQAQITGPLSKALSAGIGGWFSSDNSYMSGSNSMGSIDTSSVSVADAGSSFSAPMAFASGTDYAPGGLSLVGEQGPELMQLPGGSRIYPADETSAILSPKASNANERTGGNVVQITNYVEAGASMADVEAAVASGIQQAAPHLISAAVQQSVPASLSAVQSAANRGGSFAQSVGRR